MFGRFPGLKIPWSYYADAYTNRKACFSQQRDQPGVDHYGPEGDHPEHKQPARRPHDQLGSGRAALACPLGGATNLGLGR
jgi:hypothetical protein